MLLGHFAVAFAAKKVAPRVSLGTLFMAAQLADLVWPMFFLAGIEDFEIRPGATAVTPLEFTHYPYSHSLVALAGWAMLFGALYVLTRRAALSSAIAIAAVVVSHWVLDVIAHKPDMPVTVAGPQRLGLGLWSSVAGTVLFESMLFAAGVYLYVKVTNAADRVGSIALWALVAFLVAVYASTILGPPPPSKMAVPFAGLAMWLLVAWAYWVDRHRRVAAAISS